MDRGVWLAGFCMAGGSTRADGITDGTDGTSPLLVGSVYGAKRDACNSDDDESRPP